MVPATFAVVQLSRAVVSEARLHFYSLFFYNTVKVTLLSVIGMVLSCSLIAFALARIDFPGKNIIFTLAIMSMFFADSGYDDSPIYYIQTSELAWYALSLDRAVLLWRGVRNCFDETVLPIHSQGTGRGRKK